MLLSRKDRLLNLGFFKDDHDLIRFYKELTLVSDSRQDLIWKYGLDQVIDLNHNSIEIKNWIKSLCN